VLEFALICGVGDFDVVRNYLRLAVVLPLLFCLIILKYIKIKFKIIKLCIKPTTKTSRRFSASCQNLSVNFKTHSAGIPFSAILMKTPRTSTITPSTIALQTSLD
jgi:hypothetical protein